MPTAKTKSKIPPQLPNLRWDANERILWLGDEIVKQFTNRAQNQEILLAWIEKHGWRIPIHPPYLEGRSKQSQRERVHNTIRALNEYQTKTRIYFYFNGKTEIGCAAPPWSACPSTPKRKGDEA